MNLGMHKKCILTYLHHYAEPNGYVRSCCIARDNILDHNGNKLSIANNAFDDVINSDYMKQLRNNLAKGLQDSNCQVCWTDEKNGKESKRQRYNKLYSDVYDIHADSYDKTNSLVDMQLALGNTCNLKCRTCAPSHSSKWAAEFRDRFGKDSVDKNLTYNLADSKLFSDIDNWSKTVKRIEIMGGEPFYSNDFKMLIDRLSLSEFSKNISINFSTNGTIYNDELIHKIINKFGHVGINISIDGIGEHFDYIRHGSNWKNVKSNLDKFYNLFETVTENFSMAATITISNLNFYYLRDIHIFFEENYPGWRLSNNLVHWPSHYSAANIPDSVKEKYLERVVEPVKYGLPNWDTEKYATFIKPVVEHAQHSYNELDWHSFLSTTNSTDDYRKEKFSSVFPELFDLLKAEWS